MNKQYLWITKTANSKKLSQSSRSEDSQIRHHVQRDRIEALEGKHCVIHAQISTPLYPSVVILTPEERRSLNYFFHCTAPDWSGWQDSEFWNGIAFQACQQDQAIAHALVAIAARHEYSSSQANSILAPRLRHLASSQHSKTLTLFQSSSCLNYSAGLISSVILASLQSHIGNYQSYRLLRSGMAMHEELQRLKKLSESPSFGAAQHTISEQTSTLLSRLQERLCMMGDQPAAFASSIQYHRCQNFPKRGLPSIPASFYSLRQARDCIESILNWYRDHIIDFHGNSTTWSCFCDLLEEHVDRWKGALNISRFDSMGKHHLHLLQIAALNGMVLILSYPVQKETDYDTYTPLFRRIMDLVALIPLPKVYRARVSFGIDCGLIDIVAFVGSRCREPKIRRAALNWLHHHPRFEGERLSTVAAQIVQAWIDLEEQEGTCSLADIPESRRRRLLAGKRYHDQHLIKLLFASSPYDPMAGAKIDVVWIRSAIQTDLMDAEVSRCNEQLSTLMPDVIFSPGHAAFLDREDGVYHHLYSTTFYFPIPRT